MCIRFGYSFILLAALFIGFGCDDSGSNKAQNVDGLESCGNGSLDGTEECDDGNSDNGDGCSAECFSEIPCDSSNECGQGSTCRNQRCVPSLPQFDNCRGVECEEGQRCEAGECVEEEPVVDPCENVECAAGERCEAGECVEEEPVVDPCENVECEEGQRCEAGECVEEEPVVDPCEDVECAAGQRCEAGECVEEEPVVDPCEGVECAEGQICEAGDCVEDGPCVENSDCGENEFCKAGNCLPVPMIDFCLGVECPQGEVCVEGQCVAPPDPCVEVECEEGQRCEVGECVDVDPCEGIECADGQRCEVGECVDVDPCEVVECADGQRCEAGECIDIDPCEGVECAGGQRCEAGLCINIDPCAGVECGENQRCEAGACINLPPEDPCFGVQCDDDQRCEEGQCVVVDPCEVVQCGVNQRCETGECIDVDPCEGVQCGENQRCEEGLCVDVDPCEGIQCEVNQRCEAGECIDVDPCEGVECGVGQRCEAGQCQSLYAGCGDLISNELFLDGNTIQGSTAGLSNNFQSVRDGSNACTATDQGPEDLALFRPNQSGYACISTTGTSFDAYLFARENDCDGEQVLCMDDRSAAQTRPYDTLRMEEDTDYIVFVTGYRAASGNYELRATSGPCAACDVCDDLGQACVDGECVDQCANVDCAPGLVCDAGQCVVNPESNGTCGAPFRIEAGASVEGNIEDSASNVDAATCNFAAGGPEVVYAFIADANERYCVDVSGTAFDAIVSVQSPDCGQLADEQACVDQAAAPGQKLAFEAEAGEPYFVVLNSPDGSRGQYQMQLDTCECAVDADCGGEFIQCINNECVPDFAECTGFEGEIFVDGAPIQGSTAGQENNFGSSSGVSYLDRGIECFGSADGPEDLVLLRPNQSGFVCLSTEGSAYDTYLHVREDSCSRFSSQIACVDNRQNAGHSQAVATIQVEQDQDYVIFVDGASNFRSGDYTLTATSGPCVECDVCSASGQVCNLDTETCVECTAAEHCAEDQLCGLDNTCYFPDACANSAECEDGLVCLNRRCAPPECAVDLDCDSGLICEGGICEDDYTTCNDPREIEVGGVYQGDTYSRGRSNLASCGGTGRGYEQVYHFTVDEPVNLCITTDAADFDNIIYLREQVCSAINNEVACNDDSIGLRGQFKFFATPGEDYYLFVDGSGFSDYGEYRFTIDEAAPGLDCGEQFLASSLQCVEGVQNCASGSQCVDNQCDSGCLNDRDCQVDQYCVGGFCNSVENVEGGTCDAPQLIVPGQRVEGDIVNGARSQQGTCGGEVGKEVVYAFSPEQNGQYCINTTGSSFDTVMYLRPDNCNNFQSELDCNDDNPDFASGTGSAIEFNAVQGTTYYIIVDGVRYYEEGNYRLSLREGPCLDNDVPQCEEHEDCKRELGCVDRACEPVGDVSQCDDVECGDGAFCEAGYCFSLFDRTACKDHEEGHPYLQDSQHFVPGEILRGTTVGAPNNNDGVLCDGIETGGEAVIGFRPQRTELPVCITTQGSEISPVLYLRTNDCDNPTAEVFCEYGEDNQFTLNPEFGVTYYIFVDSPVIDGVAQEGEYQIQWYYGECEPEYPREPVLELTCEYDWRGNWDQQSNCPENHRCTSTGKCFFRGADRLYCDDDSVCPRNYRCTVNERENYCRSTLLSSHCNEPGNSCEEGLACYDRDTRRNSVGEEIAPGVFGEAFSFEGTNDGLCVDDDNGCFSVSCPYGMECVDEYTCVNSEPTCAVDADCGENGLCEHGYCIQYVELDFRTGTTVGRGVNPIMLTPGDIPIKANISYAALSHNVICRGYGPNNDGDILLTSRDGREAVHAYIAPHRGQICIDEFMTWALEVDGRGVYVYEYNPNYIPFDGEPDPRRHDVYFDVDREGMELVECGTGVGTVNVEQGRHYYIIIDSLLRTIQPADRDGSYTPYYLRIEEGSCRAYPGCFRDGECSNNFSYEHPFFQ